MAVLNALMGWRGYAATAVIAALLAGAAAWNVQGWRYDAQIADIHRAQAQALADAQAQARAVEQQRAAAIEKVQDDAQEQIAAANADAAAASDAAGRLRVELEKLRTRVAARRAGAAAGGPPAEDVVGLLAQLFSDADDAAGVLAKDLDASRAAGLACERAYDAMRQ